MVQKMQVIVIGTVKDKTNVAKRGAGIRVQIGAERDA